MSNFVIIRLLEDDFLYIVYRKKTQNVLPIRYTKNGVSFN